MKITLEEAENVVVNAPNVFWDGWNLVFVDHKTDGYAKQAGIFHHGKWGVRSVSSPNLEGLYFIAPKFRRLVGKTRNK